MWLSAQERAGTLRQELRTFVLAIVGLQEDQLTLTCAGCSLNRPHPSVALRDNWQRHRGWCMGPAKGLDASTTSFGACLSRIRAMIARPRSMCFDFGARKKKIGKILNNPS